MVSRTMNSNDLEAMEELAAVIDQLYELGGELPPRMNEKRRRLAKELEKDKNSG